MKATGKLITVLFLFFLWGCSGCSAPPATSGASPSTDSAESIAKVCSSGVGTVVESLVGRASGPVIVLEERHNSRVGQVQHAITLVRLHEQYGMKDIALEGYLKDDVPIHTDWFGRMVVGKTPEARAHVAVEFLKQGEISAAEFMALVYPDINLMPTETAITYNAELPKGMAPVDYLQKIARVDPGWAEDKGKAYESEESIMRLTGDEHLALAKEIKQYAEAKAIPLTGKERQEMDSFIGFWERRMSSNNSIVEAASSSQGAVVAANVGAFHTQGVCHLLKSSDRSYAVVKPLYAPGNSSFGDLTDAMYDRKNQRRSVFSTGLSALVVTQVPAGKKPQPVVSQAFFEAEAEIYAAVTSIAEKILGPPQPPGPPNGGKPPFQFSDDDFSGKWISINPANIEYLPGSDDRRRAVLIPISFNKTHKVIWIGATWGHGLEAGQANVEQTLEHALQEILAEPKTPQQAEDNTGHIQLSANTFAIVGRDKNAVRLAILKEV